MRQIRILDGGKPIGGGGRSPMGEAKARRLTPENQVRWARRSHAMARALGLQWDGTDEGANGTNQLASAYNAAGDLHARGRNAFHDMEAVKIAQAMNAELEDEGCFYTPPGPSAA
jgi:hypothetical protein